MRIEIQQLSKTYRDAHRELSVIDGLSAEFKSGRSTAVVGRSGIGKSTLLHLLGGLDQPSGGEVLYDEVALTALSGDELSAFRGSNIGFIFQFHHLLPEFNALENAAMPLLIGGCSEREAHERAAEVLDRVGLKSRAQHRPGELSGGEQQRIAIARAVVSEPAVILADEPTGNLDIGTAEQIRELLLELARSRGSTLIIATHSLELAHSLDSVVEMQPGGALTELMRGQD